MTKQVQQFSWKSYDEQYAKMRDDMLTWCKMVSEIPDRQKDIAERYGVSRQTVGQWNSIGMDYDYFATNGSIIPTAKNTLYQLTTLSVEERDKLLKEQPRPTRQYVEDYKRRLENPPTAPEQPPATAPKPQVRKVPPEEAKAWREEQEAMAPPVAHVSQKSKLELAQDIFGIPGCSSIHKDSLAILYRGLSAKHHPDKGGDPEAQKALNLARETLERYSYE